MGYPKVPGQRTGLTNTPRNILLSSQGVQVLPGPQYIDATYAIDGANTNRTDELRAGCLMARITSGLWVPCKNSYVSSGTSGSGSGTTTTTINVDDARFFKASDTVTVPVAAGTVSRTVSSVDYTNNILTLSSAVDNPSIGVSVIGSGAIAGSEICRGILLHTVRLLSTEPYNTTQYDTPCVILIGGLVDEDQVLGDLTAVQAYSTTKLGDIKFGNDHGIN